ncbi:hypothetical protein QLX08_001645 [Tetragonisca angustula]|uniref:Uncharacterized protein n=1 Tax=Tetragonisca angustula TaxID=166442 RepID=A0AAW1AH91_9HYME
MVQDLSLDSPGPPIDTRIMHTLNSYANARKEPRRQYIHIQHRRAAASVYTLRPVFCILSSELIQSPEDPPGDFRCGEIVIAAATLYRAFSSGENVLPGDGPDRDLGKTNFAKTTIVRHSTHLPPAKVSRT